MPKEIDVSIIIPSFNTRDILHDCLSSIYCVCASSMGKCEVILVDDCSSDDSVEMIQHDFPQIKLLTNDCNSGFSASCNKGILNAEGRYLLLLNSDTVVFPDTLERLVAFADEYTDAGIIGCAHLDGKKNVWHHTPTVLQHLDLLHLIA